MKKHTRSVIVILTALCLLLAACGKSGSETGSVSFRTSTAAENTTAVPGTESEAAQETASGEAAVSTDAQPQTQETEDTQPQAVTTTAESTLVVIDPIDPPASDPETQTDTAASTEEPGTEAESTTPAGPEDGKKYVALSFDDGPDMRYTSSTSRILDILEQYGAKATFFVLATQLDYNGVADENTGETFAQRNAKLVKRAYDLGMEIGSHTYNHKNLNTLSSGEIEKELRDACDKTEAITGAKVKIMRPPYGNANQTVRDTIDMPMIIWDVDSLDWESKDPDKIYDEVMNHVQPGSIILMHDIYNTTADGVAKVVPALIEKGYTIVTVSELYAIYGKELKPHNVYMAAWYDD